METMSSCSSREGLLAKRSNSPSFSRTVRVLFKRLHLIKIRRIAFIIEFIIGLILWLVLYPVYLFARWDYDAIEDPPINYSSLIPLSLGVMFASPNVTLVYAPDCDNTRQIQQYIDLILSYLPSLNISLNFSLDVRFVSTPTEIINTIYSKEDSGLGIYWSNANQSDALTSPKIDSYYQVPSGSPGGDLQILMFRVISYMQYDFEYTLFNFSSMTYARPATEVLSDIDILVGMFCVMPVIIIGLPDLQIILEEKDSKIQTLAFLMGCSEVAYWLVEFITQIVLSIIPYIFFCLSMSYWFLMEGTSFTLILVISLLFVISHVCFEMFVTTFLKTGKAGRMLTVILLFMAIFFTYLHQFYTLQDTNSSDAVKHVFSIFPISSYIMEMVTIYREAKNSNPLTWDDITRNDIAYPIWYGFLWMPIDAVVYFLLFLLCNLINSRNFGTPLMTFTELFSSKAWKRLFSKRDINFENLNSNEEIINVQHLSKTYHGDRVITALTDVSFSIKMREVIVIIGPNGAGKSTLLNTLSGALIPSEGTISLFGEEPTKRFQDIQKYLGVCFQDNVIIPYLNIREHFELFGTFRGLSPESINETMYFFTNTLQLTEMIDNRAGDLSGGQKRKLCISISLLGNPPIIIMDEPTAGVDIQSRQLIWKTISSLKDSTLIITSHALEEAEAVSSRLFVVYGGQLSFAGTATELRNQFNCGYVLRVEGNIENVLELAKKYQENAKLADERNDTIHLGMADNIPQFIMEFEQRKEDLGVISYSFSVEQLEDMLLKIIQTEEAAYNGAN
ncbi:ABC transporter family protein [Histomonas meleagridis]|uniref:ABC transporter family protein n=1 Tax=Histomonas meleagridis TaxID=135588 RepID=UPI00355984A0|nr:ABC transporter family protein [Histomonas meleagridis]KAH0796774.1 ABC transporter family protein [Histomonas meleagridis]